MAQSEEQNKSSEIDPKETDTLSRVRLFETLWTVAHLAPLSMGFSRQEYWSGLPFPSSSKMGLFQLGCSHSVVFMET